MQTNPLSGAHHGSLPVHKPPATRYIPLLQQAIERIGAQKANVMWLNSASQMLELAAVWGYLPESVRDAINAGELSTRAFACGEGVVGKCASTQRVICVNKAYLIPPYSDYQVLCMVSLPIFEADQLVAVLTVTNKVVENSEGEKILDPNGAFSEADIFQLVELIETVLEQRSTAQTRHL